MQSREDRPMSTTRRHAGSPLHVDTAVTATKDKSTDLSPPRTPKMTTSRPSRGGLAAPGRALRVRTTTRETFLDDITPVDLARERQAQMDLDEHRHSHDLSLSPRQITRDSLVDNMLLSLDQFSSATGGAFGTSGPDEVRLYTSLGEDDPYVTYRNGRAPHHVHSYSSDFEGTDSTHRTSSQFGRGRRSNSSSNFHAGRTKSFRGEITSGATGQRPGQQRVLHSREGKGSKGSSANSLDLGYTQNSMTHRWAQGSIGRSSSLDYIQDVQQLNSQIIRQITTAPYTAYDYDAAPTPTVPVGPRKQMPLSPEPLYPPEPMQPPPIPQTLNRKRSTRSSKSAHKNRPDTTSGLGLSFDSELNNRNRDLPPLPGFVEPQSAPAPLVGYGKSKEQPLASPQLRDKPGFFRRVFGSSKNNLNTALEPNSLHGSQASFETPERPNSKPHHVSTQTKSQFTPVSREQPPIPREKENSHVLTKKPSSFFRRRKKSISEAPPPPVLKGTDQVFLQPGKEDLVLKLSPSPTNSLRMVMKPYLGSPMDGRLEREDPMGQRDGSVDLEGDVKPFSPTYGPDPNTTIRRVQSRKQEALPAQIPTPRNGVSESYLDIDPTTSKVSNGPTIGVKYGEVQKGRQRGSSRERPRTTPERSSYPKERDEQLPNPKSPRLATVELPDPETAREPALQPLKTSQTPGPVDSSVAVASMAKEAATGTAQGKVWVKPTQGKVEEKDHRVWLEPTSSEENLGAPDSNLSLPLEGTKASIRTSGSTSTVYKSATSLPLVQVEDDDVEALGGEVVQTEHDIDESESEVPTPVDRERAQKVYDGDEDFVPKSKAAAWMGEDGAVRSRTRTAYMELFDFSNLNILAALRLLCSRLALKAESQQVDRIINAFSKRWCECNSNHGFKSPDVVHTITYSLLLLNTDLYLADIESKMTRSQFIKNTVPTIVRVVLDSAPDAFETRPALQPKKPQTLEDEGDHRLGDELKTKDGRNSGENERSISRASGRHPTDALPPRAPTPLNYSTTTDDSGPLVKAPFHGTVRTWEVQIEIVLKDFYNSIRSERLPLFGAPDEKQPTPSQSQGGLAVLANGVLRRSPSMLSRAPSEAPSFNRGRPAEAPRFGTGKWPKNRSRGRVYPNSALGSSRTSLDDQSSMWSPSVSSSTWSKYSLGKTQTSMSVDSLGSNYPQGDYQQSIGFANALSQAIIREETIGSAGSNNSEELRVAPLLEDESLELAGAPWAKEGIVKHKHHLESVDKKAKDRNWIEVFAVVEKGYMTLFSFSSKSLRHKSRSKISGGVVGGGNWQDSAENLGSFLLRHTVASSLPPPGYSKARPHVFALSLPTGAVHLFQVGTPEIVKEFVSTANYWSARLSNHPLVGGISNIEYGWSEAIINNSLVAAINEQHPRPSTGPTPSGPRTSLQSSLRSSLDQGTGAVRPRLPGDRVLISDWTPPTQSMRASNLMEQDQLRALVAYVQGIEDELQRHNQLRGPMLLAFTPRQSNAAKAMANWEKKSSYLLREIVKFRTYIDILQAAETSKQKIYRDRDEFKKTEDDLEADKEMDDVRGVRDLDDEGDATLKSE